MQRETVYRLAERRRTSPNSEAVLYHLARAQLVENREHQSRETAEAGLQRHPGSARLIRIHALSLAALGRHPEALRELTDAHRLGDRHVELFAGIARLEMAQGRLSEALTRLEEGVRQHPRAADLWLLLGQCRGGLGMPEAWREAAGRVTRLKPAREDGWISLASACLFQEDLTGALAAAESAVKLAEGSWEAQLILARARALATRLRGDPWRLTRDTFFRALERAETPLDRADVLRELGAAALELDSAPAAIDWFEQALSLTPGDPALHYQLSQAHRRAGNPDRAAAYLRKFEQQASRERRIRYLRATLAADPGHRGAREELGRLLGPGELGTVTAE